MIRLSRRASPWRVIFLAVPLAGIFVGRELVLTQHQLHWLAPVAVAVGIFAIASNLAFEFLILRFLIRVLPRRGVTLLEGLEPMNILFPGLTLLIAMIGALGLAPARRLATRRALVLVFSTQFILTLALRLL
jgi:hypothetical protein